MSIKPLKKWLHVALHLAVLLCFMPDAAMATTSSSKPASSKSATKKSTSTTKAKTSTKKKTTKTTKKSTKKQTISSARRPVTPSVQRERYAALVVNASTGQILYEVNGSARRYPASLTKMMTLYLLFEQMKKGELTTDSMFSVSAKAASMPQTNISLSEGDRISVKTVIESLIIRSANDTAMVVAENLAGSQEGFARLMNAKAKQLGMTGTNFTNPNGLPDDRQYSTAYDMARLGIALRRDFPEYYHYLSDTEFYFRGKRYEGHNRLLGRYPGTDGIKTGYINKSGFNLVTSVKRSGWNLVGVVMGGTTGSSRDRQMMEMLDDVFATLAKKS
jgi:D-alanyl-D-alanine carboxypeptidase